MRKLIIAFVCCSLILAFPIFGESSAHGQETIRVAPSSGGVELDEIYVVRWTALGAVKAADLTNMKIGLLFAAKWEPTDTYSPPLIHLQALSPIEDDTGRVLSTENRLKEIEFLQGEVRGTTWKGFGGKQGPVVSLLLDAPARGATTLKTIKGKAVVTLTKQVSLNFKDLASVNGKELRHPDMKSLAAMKLRFSITEKDGRVTATISAPVNYASPWNRGRLYNWNVTEGGRRLNLASEGTSPAGEGVAVEKTYHRRTIKGLSLRLDVLEAVESKTFDFEFRKVELP